MPNISVQDLDWSSIGAYINSLEVGLGLYRVNVSAVWSFGIGKGDFDGLSKRKYRLAEEIEESTMKMCVYVQQRKEGGDPPDDAELAIIRSMYRSNVEHSRTCREHAERAKELHDSRQALFSDAGLVQEDDGEEITNDLPF